MTQAQKIIKYLATALAVALIVAIISVILSGSYFLFKTVGLIHTDKNIITDDLKVISNEVVEIRELDVDLAFTNLEIKHSDVFKVETNNSKITFRNSNGIIKVKEGKYNWFNNANNSNLVIYLPENYLSEVKIDGGAGKINIDKLNAELFDLELGAGDVYIKNLTVTDNAKIEGGAGKVELKYAEVNNLKADLGVGEFNFNGKLTGRSKIDSGVGAINIDLTDSLDNYLVEVDKGIGNVTINGEKALTSKVYGNGDNYLDIDGGVGEIKINFME